MKQLLAWISALFGGGKKKPPVIVVPPPAEKPPLPLWHDKRPIGMVMLSNYQYWTDTDNYMTDDFKAFAEQCITYLRYINAQGCVVWDPGGSKWPRAYTYYGDPKLAPEKVDIFFSTILAAGFRVGVCLRPDEIRWEPSEYWATTPEHYTVSSPRDNLIAKTEYANKRWGATLFYVDSNVGEGMAPGSINTTGYGGLMPASIFSELHKLYPDFLFIPEHSNEEYKLSTMPYFPKNHPPPGSGGHVVDCGDTGWTVEQLSESVKQGNILMGRVWYEAPELDKIKKAYK